ncbi:hypothetical protein C8J57DRAFT_1502050 [Mycena rebaudengoi]|nr:hypothetical protein C8J57DRAFT_1502050 [Mycena rebaudengoi]
MFSKSLILVASLLAASALAIGPTPDVGNTVVVCGASTGADGCRQISVNSAACQSFNGRLSFLNNTVSTAKIPLGFVCTFFDAEECTSKADSKADSDVVLLDGGTWDFSSVPGISGTVDFTDRASSFTCSPV